MDVDGCNHEHDDNHGEGELAALARELRGAERLLAQAVVRAGRLAGSGEAERVAGQPLDLWLGVACRQVGADRATLITAGEVLADMPVVRGLFLDGAVSWGQTSHDWMCQAASSLAGWVVASSGQATVSS